MSSLFPALPFKTRIFVALVGISAITSLAIGLVLYYFAGTRLVTAETEALTQRSQTANSGAVEFVSGLRNPEDRTIPEPESYAEELVRSVDPTGARGSLHWPRRRTTGSPQRGRAGLSQGNLPTVGHRRGDVRRGP